jgi:crotonobetainyl-CoA:carnitine CoA-transferase CaiB-like acyl-CoA transferase
MSEDATVQTTQRTPLPLAGICVVEIGHSLAAPYAGMILGSLGAEVIKIENAGKGDYARDWGPPFIDGAAALFHAINHGKSSISMSFGNPEEVSLLKALIERRADVVLQNLKAGGVEKYGLGAAQLMADKPSLVYCNLGAFGTTGPLRDKPGYDPLVQALGGLMSFLGGPGEPLSRIPVSVNDMGTGLWAAIGVLAALFRRQVSGSGELVDVSLYETAISWGGVQIADYLASGVLPGRWGSGTAAIVPHQAFECADATIMVAAGNDGLFRKLCAVLGTTALADDARFMTNGARVSNREALIELLQQAFRAKPSSYWLDTLDAAGIPSGPIQTIDQVVVHEQTQALDILKRTSDGAATVVGLPISFGGVRPGNIGRTPGLGEHNHLLEELEKTDQEKP